MEEQWQCEEFCVHDKVLAEIEPKRISEAQSQQTAELFKALGDATRMKILYYLLQKELCVCDLTVLVGASQSAVSHQLRVLKQAKLVKNRREGKIVYYSLADAHIQSILNQGMEHINE